MAGYLDSNGLLYLWSKIKTLVGEKITVDSAMSSTSENPVQNKAVNAALSKKADLDSNGKIPTSQLPSYVDDVIEGYLYNEKFYEDSAHTSVITGEGGKIYVDLTTNLSYRFSGSTYVQITSSDVVPITNAEIDEITAE